MEWLRKSAAPSAFPEILCKSLKYVVQLNMTYTQAHPQSMLTLQHTQWMQHILATGKLALKAP